MSRPGIPALRRLGLALALCCAAGSLAAAEENIVFPADAGHIDLTQPPYGLKGDGATDNTEALRRAFLENRGKSRTLYFPNGTYLFSDRINISGDEPSKPHSADRFLNLQGQSTRGVVLRLKDQAPGFADPDKPKTFISLYEGASTGDVMHSYVCNLTIEVGAGNPGAAALRFISNNRGAIKEVAIRSEDPEKRGAIGLDLRQSQQGPALVRNVSVDGFDRGIEVGNTFFMVFEHIILCDQRKVGLSSCGRSTLRGLKSRNRVPVFISGKHDQLTLIDADLTGGDPGEAALVSSGNIYLRDVRVEGYGDTVRNREGKSLLRGDAAEWFPGPGRSLFGADPRSLRLPILEPPPIPWEQDLGRWVKVEPGEDRLQEAIDLAAKEGRTTVYFPKLGKDQDYIITRPVRVHGSVSRLYGMDTSLCIDERLPAGATVLTFEDLRGPVVVERFFNFRVNKGWRGLHDRFLVESRSEHPVILRHTSKPACTLKQANPGRSWFIDDVATYAVIGKGETLYCRQLNPESPRAPMVVVDGGTFWCLGLKTEGRATHIEARNGAKVELIGGVSYQSWKNQPVDPPMFLVSDSEASFTIGQYVGPGAPAFSTMVEETRGAETRTLPFKALAPAWHLHLYRSGGPPPAAP